MICTAFTSLLAGRPIIDDAPEPPAHLDARRELAIPLEDIADRGSISFGDNEHAAYVGSAAGIGKRSGTGPVVRERDGRAAAEQPSIGISPSPSGSSSRPVMCLLRTGALGWMQGRHCVSQARAAPQRLGGLEDHPKLSSCRQLSCVLPNFLDAARLQSTSLRQSQTSPRMARWSRLRTISGCRGATGHADRGTKRMRNRLIHFLLPGAIIGAPVPERARTNTVVVRLDLPRRVVSERGRE